MSEIKCSRYTFEDLGDYAGLCKCPICGGFLPQDFPIDKPFKCKKCGAELITLPDHDEETKEGLEWGRICPIKKGERKV
jgi:transcription initiation factor IIE alpha subunit